MQRHLTRIIVALLTFVIGISAANWLSTAPESSQTQLPGVVNPSPISKYAPLPCSFKRSKRKLSPTEAIRLAECYVIANGYTDLPPMEDTSKLSYESWGDGPPAEEALERRHDTIESRAYGVSRGGRANDGWSVVFRYNINNPSFSVFTPQFLSHLRTVGRCVTMDAYGRNLRVQHEDAILSTFERTEELPR